MGYKLLGWVVWHGAMWLLRRKLRGAPGRRGLLVGLLVAGAAGAAAAVAGGRRAGD